MYNIGQVVFVVLNKKQQIFPMQVVEMVTKKTLRGEEVKYCLQAGSDKSTMIMMDQIDGEIFMSPEEAKRTLVTRATQQISRLIDSAEKKAKEWYFKEEAQDLETASEQIQIKEPQITFAEESEEHTVVLPDGNVARIKLPTM